MMDHELTGIDKLYFWPDSLPYLINELNEKPPTKLDKATDAWLKDAYIILDNARRENIAKLSADDLNSLGILASAVFFGDKKGLYRASVELYDFTALILAEIRLRIGRIDGYVYILKSEPGQRKIGRAKNPADRIKTFSVKLPFRVSYEMVIPSMDYKALEEVFHEAFADRRVRGEWFDLSRGDIDYIMDTFPNFIYRFE